MVPDRKHLHRKLLQVAYFMAFLETSLVHKISVICNTRTKNTQFLPQDVQGLPKCQEVTVSDRAAILLGGDRVEECRGVANALASLGASALGNVAHQAA